MSAYNGANHTARHCKIVSDYLLLRALKDPTTAVYYETRHGNRQAFRPRRRMLIHGITGQGIAYMPLIESDRRERFGRGAPRLPSEAGIGGGQDGSGQDNNDF